MVPFMHSAVAVTAPLRPSQPMLACFRWTRDTTERHGTLRSYDGMRVERAASALLDGRPHSDMGGSCLAYKKPTEGHGSTGASHAPVPPRPYLDERCRYASVACPWWHVHFDHGEWDECVVRLLCLSRTCSFWMDLTVDSNLCQEG